MPGRIPKVVVIGGTFVDMAIRCSQIPSAGQSVSGSALSYSATGPGPNQAVEAALCGCEVHLISKVGGGPFAKMVKAKLAEFDVNTEFVYKAEAKNTGVVVTVVNAKGENASCIYTGASSALRPEDIEAAEQVISGADSCLIHSRLPQQTIIKAIRCAKLHRTKVILNPARPIEQTGRQNINFWFPQGEVPLPIEYFSADILTPNLCEAADITEYSLPSSSRREKAKLIGSDLVARGAGSAVITMGRHGCLVVDRNGVDHIPAFEVELVDQTCRGDAFAGALAAYYAANAIRHPVEDDIREAVKFASAAGALACTKFGSIEALPTKAEIIELLQKEDIG